MTRPLLSALAMVVWHLACPLFSSAQQEFTAEQLNKTERIICVWKKGTAEAALGTIKNVGLDVLQIGKSMPVGVCKGKLTPESLKKLLGDPNIRSVEPDLELTLTQDSADTEGLQEINDDMLAAYEHAGRMLCVWKKGKKDLALAEIARLGKLRVLQSGTSIPFVVCDWTPPLTKETLGALKKSPLLDYVEPDLSLVQDAPKEGRFIEFANGTVKTDVVGGRVLATPDDPDINKLWGLKSIHAPQAWVGPFESKALVAIIDTGVDIDHPDLMANLAVNTGEQKGNGVDDDKNGFVDDLYGANFTALPSNGNVQDGQGHGTHVAGTVGAVGNNKIAVAGVCWRVPIVVAKVFNDDGDAPLASALILAIDYAIVRKARIINLSLGWTDQRGALKLAMDSAEASGILVVCAAGNLRPNQNAAERDIDAFTSYPGSYTNENLLVVANVTEQGHLNQGSMFGATSVDLGAPGTDIVSTYPRSKAPSGLKALTGTSMASPYVAGAAALILGSPQHQQLGSKELKSLILKRVRPFPELQGRSVSGGVLDIEFLGPQAAPSPAQKPPIVKCPPPRAFVPSPPKPHSSYRLHCGRH